MSDEKVRFSEINDITQQRTREGKPYLEFLRVPAMSAGLYVLPAGGVDRQSPHQQDELYYVVEGKARMRAGSLVRELARGSLIYVPAQVEHRFYDIEEEIVLLVFFAPAESD